VALDESLAASGRDRHVPAGSGTPLDFLGFVQPGAYANLKFRPRTWPLRNILGVTVAVADFCALLAAAAAVFALYFNFLNPSATEWRLYVLPALFAATLFVGGFERLGGYRLRQLSRLYWQLTHAMMTWGVTVSVLFLAAFFEKTSETYSRGWTLAWIISGPAVILIGRGILHYAIIALARNGHLTRNVVVVGAGNEGQQLIAKLQTSQDKSIAIRGVFDDRKSRLPGPVRGFKVLGTTDDLPYFARHVSIDEVIVALPLDAEQRLQALFHKLKLIAIDLRLSVEPVAQRFQVRGVSYIGDVPVFEIADRPLKHWRAVIKWIEDKVIASILLICAGPLMAMIALLIKLDSPGPVLFIQERFGYGNGVIRVFKFRTMYVHRGDQSGAQRTVSNDPRVTGIGRILRLMSLDELPQLVNVLRGDMSLVGPRPHAIAMKAGGQPYADAVQQYLHRHRVKPGITGWAQVNGLRGEIDTVEKARDRVAHDLYYIEHWSPWLDLKILLKTVGILATRENAY
jgi:Undecaprenyl-phosphate glucose phosphotransferase